MRQRGNAKTALVIVLLAGFWGWFFYKAPIDYLHSKLKEVYADVVTFVNDETVREEISEKAGQNSTLIIEAQEACHGKSPKHGKQYLYSEQAHNLKQKSKLWVNNEHVYPVWITLFDVDTLDPLTSVYIKPGKHSKFQMPVGEYEVEVQSGSTWCNFSEGFEELALLEPDTLLSIIPDEVAYISLSSFGSMPSDMMFSNVEPAATYNGSGQKVRGTGSIALQKVWGDHYAVQGSINQKPVFFLVDTGASRVSVPHDFAKHAGVKGCQKVKRHTANGVADGCIGIAQELEIGQFTFNNVEITYSKGMPADTFLLGMSILSQFKMVQQDEQMTLSR